ncbi:peptidase S8 [Kaistia algarum]|uniref:S8 family serine peptidase n=1 Tax=Kaistia algarum TaxID=2083279 RepID=UPI000CE7994E|nr:S8 family serine peptidase [Kaistia algarum]MCX5516730.1 S8 family serine peptidase [Kaistia algarum]PPE78622.1 peptidase S8 [Kaistia algarum]
MANTRLLVKVRGDGKNFLAATGKAFGAAGVDVRTILTMPPSAKGKGLAPSAGSAWLQLLAPGAGGGNPWDDAHQLLLPGQGFAAAAAADVQFVEPDIQQQWLPLPREVSGAAAAATADRCAFDDQDPSGGKAVGPGIAWNFGDGYSELAKARAALGPAFEQKLSQIVIAHLDTGYDPQHVTRPLNLDTAHQHSFVDGDPDPGDASDHTPTGMSSIRNRGHGTATLALLAGKKLDGTSPNWPGFNDFIGGAPYARVIPIRIADWVVRFSTGTMVQGIDYAIRQGAHVLSMSMGGLTSAALVDAINLAYDSGMVMVTAAGNNYAGSPMPRSIVYPARYRRVLAACGVMADGRAYAELAAGTMQGSYGPDSKMQTALGAFTPNVPWAMIDCGKAVDMDGAGTSSATPQIAAAMALWLAEHRQALAQYPEAWMRVEAARRALFTSAAKSTAAMNAAETLQKIGQGVMKAAAALQQQPVAVAKLVKLPPAKASLGWLDILLGTDPSFAAASGDGRGQMLALELTQMAQRVAAVDAAIGDPDLPEDQIPEAERRRYLEAALDAGNPSRPLRAALETKLGRLQVPVVPIKRKQKALPPPKRRLRVYALDPSVAKSLDSVAVNETTLTVRWEEKLKPGPVGEYLEVVDIDPASNRLYDPVDLDEPKLLAQDGWPPSEGNPGFHQQMVYAVAMTTIDHFEEALGRKALWAPRLVVKKDNSGQEHYESLEVGRLRLYPHALRTENAYYSPEKVALLFGYFPAQPKEDDATAPGTMVFACLSSDIVAHEMSHALLDGLHRRFQEASNPDVPAFHEAFADIVALFQHFTIPELVRFQIAQAHGKLSAAELLGGLAKQFGEGTQRGGPLRDYLAAEVHALDYATTTEVHARGSILVSAVYDAFLRIVERRTALLIRLATNGTGILPEGALHPDLVDALTDESCKAARHVLRMCIRALDYCPAVDITFGEYLRALITADIDLVPDDRFYYRVAFMESFRRRGLLPRDVRTVSEETLAWGTLDDPKPKWLPSVLAELDLSWDRELDRSQVFELNKKNCRNMWRALKAEFDKDPKLLTQFGLIPDVPHYDQEGNIVKLAKPGETNFEVFSVRPARRVAPDGSFRVEVVATIQQRRRLPLDPDNEGGPWFWFRGGTTLILDTRKGSGEVRYSIVKNSASPSRMERQRQTASGNALSPLRQLYFGETPGEPFALLHTHDGGPEDG